MLWRVQYKKAMGLVRGTATEPDRDTAIERALKLYDNGYAAAQQFLSTWDWPAYLERFWPSAPSWPHRRQL